MAFGDHPLDEKKVVGLIDAEVVMENEVLQVKLFGAEPYLVGPAPCFMVVEALEGKYNNEALEDRAEHGLVTKIAGTAQFEDDTRVKFVYERNEALGFSFVWLDEIIPGRSSSKS
jgi:hypothetical protein